MSTNWGGGTSHGRAQRGKRQKWNPHRGSSRSNINPFTTPKAPLTQSTPLPEDHPLMVEMAQLKIVREKRRLFWSGVQDAIGEEWDNPAAYDRQTWEKEESLADKKFAELAGKIALAERGIFVDGYTQASDIAGLAARHKKESSQAGKGHPRKEKPIVTWLEREKSDAVNQWMEDMGMSKMTESKGESLFLTDSEDSNSVRDTINTERHVSTARAVKGRCDTTKGLLEHSDVAWTVEDEAAFEEAEAEREEQRKHASLEMMSSPDRTRANLKAESRTRVPTPKEPTQHLEHVESKRKLFQAILEQLSDEESSDPQSSGIEEVAQLVKPQAPRLDQRALAVAALRGLEEQGLMDDEDSDWMDVDAVDHNDVEKIDLQNKLDSDAEEADDEESFINDSAGGIDVTLSDRANQNPRASTKSDHALPQNLSWLPRERSSTPFPPLQKPISQMSKCERQDLVLINEERLRKIKKYKIQRQKAGGHLDIDKLRVVNREEDVQFELDELKAWLKNGK